MRFVCRRVALGLTVASATWGCGGSATVPKPPPVSVAGTWVGTESDRLGPAILRWSLTQDGSAVSGTAIMRPVNAKDGSCASCHKSKVGTFSGTVSGTTLSIAMFFAKGGKSDPTPACSITLNSTAASIAESAITGTYGGSDPCEGIFDGKFAMTRRP